MEDDGLGHREIYAENPLRVEYFTDIEEVVKWIYDHSERFYDKNNPDTVNYNSLGKTGTASNIRKLDFNRTKTLIVDNQGLFYWMQSFSLMKRFVSLAISVICLIKISSEIGIFFRMNCLIQPQSALELYLA